MDIAVPVELGRDAARHAARDELSRPEYAGVEPSLFERIGDWIARSLQDLLDRAADASPGGYAGLVVAALLVVLALVALRLRLGPLGRSARQEAPLFLDATRSAADHRAAADRHAAAGQWREAVRERLRAIVRALEERGLLDPRPGRTAGEAAAEAGAALPAAAEPLRGAARLFEDVWYGGRSAGPDADRRLRDLDAQLAHLRTGATG